MNFEQEYLAKDELELSVGRLLKQCLRKMKWIVICAIVFAVLVPGVMYIKDVVLQEEETFTDEEINDIENYLILNERLERYEKYKEESPLMNMDFNHVYQITNRYYVQAEEEIQKNVVTVLVSYMNSYTCKAAFAEKAGIEDNTYATDFYNVGPLEESGITIYVGTSEKEDAEQYMLILQELLFEKQRSLAEIVGTHEFFHIGEIILEDEYGAEAYTVQSDYYTNVAAHRKTMETLLKSMTDEQKIAIMEQCDVELELLEPVELAWVSWLIYVCLGFAVGVVLSVMIIVLLALFNGKLQSEQELAKRLQITHFGTGGANYKQESLSMTCLQMTKVLETEGKKQVDLISSEDVLSNDYICKLCSMLEENQIHANVLGDVITQKEAMAELSGANPVVLVETVGKSMVSKIYQEAELCRDMNVKVMGYIAMNIEETK